MGGSMVFGSRTLHFDRPRVMGILNVTPDSFSDGGRFNRPDAALERAARMVEAGAALVDVGGESTRPGAAQVSVQEEIDRVCPVVERIARTLDVVISVDTSTPEVITQSVALGAAFINDVRALRRPGSLEAASAAGVPVCIMHMQGEPGVMQRDPQYRDVVGEVIAFLRDRTAAARGAGIPADRIVIDPGFGFGKTVEHNLELLRALPRLVAEGYPVLAGLSRKSMLARITGRAVDERLAGSLALATVAALQGAAILRVHDVEETMDAMKVVAAVQGELR